MNVVAKRLVGLLLLFLTIGIPSCQAVVAHSVVEVPGAAVGGSLLR